MENVEESSAANTQPITIESQEHEELQVPNPAWGVLLPAAQNFPTVELRDIYYKVGRDTSCTIVLERQMLTSEKCFSSFSKEHFSISKDDDRVVIEDLSTNGTFINGQRIARKSILESGDCIALSNKHISVFTFINCLPGSRGDLNYPKEVLEKYTIANLVGKGASGEVRRVYLKGSAERYALKIIAKCNNESQGMNTKKLVSNEIDIMKSLDHPCVVKIIDVMDYNDYCFLVLEFLEGGTLANRVKPNYCLREEQAKLIFYQLLLAVKYLHSMGIAHRDLKPENILLTTHAVDTLIKVSDFGLSKAVTEAPLKTFCGSLKYLAPEVIDGGGKEYTHKVDVWSLGVILYLSLMGKYPFDENNDIPLLSQIRNGDFPRKGHQWLSLSADVRSIIQAMLTTDPTIRPTVDQLLSSRWLQDKTIKMKAEKLMGNPEAGCSDETPSSTGDNKSRMVDMEKELHACKKPRLSEPETPETSTELDETGRSTSPCNKTDGDLDKTPTPLQQIKYLSCNGK